MIKTPNTPNPKKIVLIVVVLVTRSRAGKEPRKRIVVVVLRRTPILTTSCLMNVFWLQQGALLQYDLTAQYMHQSVHRF
ncbi:hypothetical protein [uncultured Legionella sp.]|uniref:hypothetical protein n=1 Tax=uncultured Legionella sp. TaxID=210934 RepID=UPI0026211098|nr:hypothetical protein [uncultured Legionella sp.]